MTVTREAVHRTSSLVPTPAVVAHRGASGHRPEHTLDAYRTAIRMGVDDIELDLVATRDGVLVARHDLELSATTDVADRPGLAHLRRTLVVDGVEQHGWFVQDLTLPELKTLAARERMPGTRPGNTAYDGAEGVPTLTEVLAMVGAESVRRGRPVGVAARAQARRPPRRGRPAAGRAAAARAGAAGARPPVGAGGAHVVRGRPSSAGWPSAPGCPSCSCSTAAHALTPDELDRIDEYADGIGAHTLARAAAGRGRGDRRAVVPRPRRAPSRPHRPCWTVRAENRFLPTNLRRGTPPTRSATWRGRCGRCSLPGSTG